MKRIIIIKDDNPEFIKILALAHEAGCEIVGPCDECALDCKKYNLIDIGCSEWEQK